MTLNSGRKECHLAFLAYAWYLLSYVKVDFIPLDKFVKTHLSATKISLKSQLVKQIRLVIYIDSSLCTTSTSMAPPNKKLVVPIDLKKKPREQELPLHNRWHPDIPPVAEVQTGEVFKIEMVDWTGGAIKDDNSASDVKYVDLSTVSTKKPYLFHLQSNEGRFSQSFVPKRKNYCTDGNTKD